jgi:cell division protein FtsI (penicillin-binding protein 3)
MTTRASGRSPEVRRRFLLAGVLLSALLATGRAFQLGVVEGESWRARALDQQGDTLSLPAPRGTIYDRDGVPLATSREVFSVAIAPREIRDTARVEGLLREHLGLTRQQAAQHTSSRRTWIPLAGRFGPEVREALVDVPGVHFERVLQRFYPNGEVSRELLGAVGLDGAAQSGLELELDTLLNGRPGRAMVRRDSRGRPLPGAMLRAVEPTAGRDVYLTIHHDLQEIAEQALREALERTNAAGGELLLTDPRTGEILAAVSRGRNGRSRSWRAVTEPYEPGSTIKPFTVAALLRLQRARLTDSVYAEQGRYVVHGRTMTDVKGHGWLTLEEGLRYSSNIALAKVGARLQWHEQYLALRDFGFGSPTGVSYPSESGGRLRRPAQWSRQSAASLSIGYEMSVTPLQMAMAYGAVANGGLLLEPRLVREVRSRDGRVEKRVETRTVRRVIPAEVAEQLRDVLTSAVEDGTGRAAALGQFLVAGKTGTVRIAAQGRYRAGAYYASFAGFFPAGDPQLVIIVKLDEPQGAYYGGVTAAPVTRATLEAALAARGTPLDRAAMARPMSLPASDTVPNGVAPSGPGGDVLPHRMATGGTVPSPRVVVLREPLPPPFMGATGLFASPVAAASAPVSAGSGGPSRAGVTAASPTTEQAAVPDVTGMPMRDGVRRLHSAGFRLRVEGTGRVVRTIPEAGAAASPDAVIRVIGQGAA